MQRSIAAKMQQMERFRRASNEQKDNVRMEFMMDDPIVYYNQSTPIQER